MSERCRRLIFNILAPTIDMCVCVFEWEILYTKIDRNVCVIFYISRITSLPLRVWQIDNLQSCYCVWHLWFEIFWNYQNEEVLYMHTFNSDVCQLQIFKACIWISILGFTGKSKKNKFRKSCYCLLLLVQALFTNYTPCSSKSRSPDQTTCWSLILPNHRSDTNERTPLGVITITALRVTFAFNIKPCVIRDYDLRVKRSVHSIAMRQWNVCIKALGMVPFTCALLGQWISGVNLCTRMLSTQKTAHHMFY